MNMNIIEKFVTIFKYMFSSFLSLEIFIFTFLLLLIVLINLIYKNKIMKLISSALYIGFILGVIITYTDYTKSCIDGFVKWLMNYIYFPSTVVYFFIILFVTVVMIYTILSKKMSTPKKAFNYVIFTFVYCLFMLFVSLSASSGVDLSNTIELYKNNIILSLVQVSNLLLVIWIVITLFYKLYKYLRKKFD